MPLDPGSRLGPYEILAPIGAGGMGEVYRAKDTRLDRTVAVKVLPKDLSARPEFRERFEREARAISSLNHPHICTLHDVGQQDGIDYLVLEYLEGETLAERLLKGALPIDQVLRYAIEIADALDRAHRQGIVHRDLKPGNVMLTRGGAKLLDFGLAKLRPPESRPSVMSTLSALATQERPLTTEGSIIGTFQYMAPEQIEGQEPDARTDIFAFGAVLYEMATGRRAFEGKSQASLIAAILEREPLPVSQVQPLTPAALERVVLTCLAKDPDDRWQSARDLGNELKWIVSSASKPGAALGAAPRPRGRERAAWAVAAAATIAAITFAAIAWRAARQERRPSLATRFAIAPPGMPSTALGALTLSADGRQLAIAAFVAGKVQLHLRRMEDPAVVALRGTEGGAGPFFSPDGRSIGFFADGKLKKVDTAGGTPMVICDAPQPRGGSWAADGTIAFAPKNDSGLFRVSADGGIPQPLTTLSGGERSHRWPEVLPGGRAVIFAAEEAARSRVVAVTLTDGKRSAIVEDAGYPKYARGRLLFARDGTLLALPFDEQRLAPTASVVPAVERVDGSTNTRAAAYALASSSGTLVYVSGEASPGVKTFASVDRHGKASAVALPPRDYEQPRLSPDGRRVAVTVREAGRQGAQGDVWVGDLERGTLSRLTFGPFENETPAWTPDGLRIVFGRTASMTADKRQTLVKRADGSGAEEVLTESERHDHVSDVHPSGVAVLSGFNGMVSDIFVLPMDGGRQVRPHLQTPFNERAARLSPDGRWMAYTSDETGRDEVYVQAFPGAGGKWQISTDGGIQPTWARNGREIFYRSGSRTMAVAVTTAPTFSAGRPAIVFETAIAQGNLARGEATYDVAPDGRFLILAEAGTGDTFPSIDVVLDWAANFGRGAPAGQ